MAIAEEKMDVGNGAWGAWKYSYEECCGGGLYTLALLVMNS